MICHMSYDQFELRYTKISSDLIEMSTYHKIDLIVYYHNKSHVYNNLQALKDSILAYKTL